MSEPRNGKMVSPCSSAEKVAQHRTHCCSNARPKGEIYRQISQNRSKVAALATLAGGRQRDGTALGVEFDAAAGYNSSRRMQEISSANLAGVGSQLARAATTGVPASVFLTTNDPAGVRRDPNYAYEGPAPEVLFRRM